MNLKQAKQLRKLAKSVTLNNEKLFEDLTYMQHTKRNYVVVHPHCLRGVYHRLKKMFRAGVKR